MKFLKGIKNSIVGICTSTFAAGLFLIVVVGLVQSVITPTHVDAIVLLEDKIIALYLFLIVGGSLISLFNCASYYQKQTATGLVVITLTSAVILFAIYKYITIILAEVERRKDITLSVSALQTSFYIMIAMASFQILGNLLLAIHKFFGKPVER